MDTNQPRTVKAVTKTLSLTLNLAKVIALLIIIVSLWLSESGDFRDSSTFLVLLLLILGADAGNNVLSKRYSRWTWKWRGVIEILSGIVLFISYLAFVAEIAFGAGSKAVDAIVGSSILLAGVGIIRILAHFHDKFVKGSTNTPGGFVTLAIVLIAFGIWVSIAVT